VVLLGFYRSEVSVNAAAGRVEEGMNACDAGGLEYVVGQQGSLVEVHAGLGGRPGNVRVRGQVDNHLMAPSGVYQCGQVFYIGLNDRQARIGFMSRQVPAATGGEVVVHGDRLDPLVGQ
jgi:hypothetical protein